MSSGHDDWMLEIELECGIELERNWLDDVVSFGEKMYATDVNQNISSKMTLTKRMRQRMDISNYKMSNWIALYFFNPIKRIRIQFNTILNFIKFEPWIWIPKLPKF